MPSAALPGMKVSRSQKFGSLFAGLAEKTPPDTEMLFRFTAGWSEPNVNQPRSERSLMSHGSWKARVA